MKWAEFTSYMRGLSGETPLGRVISIRSEEDKDTLKHFTDDQKRIRNEYRRKVAKKMLQGDQKSVEADIRDLQRSLKAAFGKK